MYRLRLLGGLALEGPSGPLSGIELWKDCDPELRSLVEAAERALERVAGEPG